MRITNSSHPLPSGGIGGGDARGGNRLATVATKYGLGVLVWLVMASAAFAEVKAVIEGPATGKAGDLVVLSGMNSLGDGFKWIMPAGLQTLSCGEGAGQVAFATGTAGEYTFGLVAADKEAAIDIAKHTVRISGALVPIPDPIPDKPVPDKPTPIPALQQLERLSAEAAGRLADSATARSLAAAIRMIDVQVEQQCLTRQCPGLDAVKAMMVVAIERKLLERVGESRNRNWLDGWRRPVNQAIEKFNPVDVPAYRAAMRAVATGLESS